MKSFSQRFPRASKSTASSRAGGKVGGMNGAGQEEDACAPWPRGRFRAATCAPTLSLSPSPTLSPSLSLSPFHPPDESTAASRIYKGSLGIATLRIITAVTCEPLNSRSAPVTRDALTLKNLNPVSWTICILYTYLHVPLCRPLFSLSSSFLFFLLAIIYLCAQ